MAKVLVVGGGFGGVVAAESLAASLGDEHQITLISRSCKFLFYPALVRLAFGRSEPDDISFDLREVMLDRRIQFVEGDVTRISPIDRRVRVAHGDVDGEMPYDALILALGRRLATERIPGFFENAHHLLTIDGAFRFGEAVRAFERGHAVIGHCPGARLPGPLFETAVALSRSLEERGKRERAAITIVTNEPIDQMFGGAEVSDVLTGMLESHGIEFVSDFAIARVTPTGVVATDGRVIDGDLRMIIPPFCGPGAIVGSGITDAEGYVRVEPTMQVSGLDQTYAAGDCVNFAGPKTAHMAVRQGEVAADNVAAELQGQPPEAIYDHEMKMVIDAYGGDSVFLRKDLGTEDAGSVRQGRFWWLAKRAQEQYWKSRHA